MQVTISRSCYVLPLAPGVTLTVLSEKLGLLAALKGGPQPPNAEDCFF